MIAPATLVDVTGIHCPIVSFDWPFAREEAERIDRHWSERCAAKPALFDGRVLLSRVPHIAGGILHAEAFEVAFRAFLSWRDFAFPGDVVRNLFAMPALRAADGAFMLGEMSASTANGGRLYFPAGTPEPSDAGADGCVDFDANILRELEEETGLRRDEVSLDAHWSIVFAGPLVACMKVTRSRLSARDLQSRVAEFVSTQAHPELDGLIAVRTAADFDRDRMPPFMLNYLDVALMQT